MGYNLGIKDEIVIIDSKTSLEFYEVKELVESLNKSSNKKYKYAISNNSLGYWKGYDLELNKSIYCGTMSQKTSIEQIKEYINGKEI